MIRDLKQELLILKLTLIDIVIFLTKVSYLQLVKQNWLVIGSCMLAAFLHKVVSL